MSVSRTAPPGRRFGVDAGSSAYMYGQQEAGGKKITFPRRMAIEEMVSEENHHDESREDRRGEGGGHISRARVTRENWTLELISVIKEQIFLALAALQTQPISRH